MKQLYTASATFLLLTGCLGLESDDPTESDVESEVAPQQPQGAVGQGSQMQGSQMQGSQMQGSQMQGSQMQGSQMQGGTYGGSAVTGAAINGTALSFKQKSGSNTIEYSPTRKCTYNKKGALISCQNYNLSASQPSPLIGSEWQTTFKRVEANGSTTTIPVTLRIEAVRKDQTWAMFPLNGSDFATGTVGGCENPLGCRQNTDIFNYDVRAINVIDANGNPEWLCPTGQTAIALSGVWDSTGQHVSNTGLPRGVSPQFTFACTNGTIAKCTRWGYRGYDRAIKTNDSVRTSLYNYHQSCVRAAMADYCGIGKTFTKDGTVIDIYDLTVSSYQGKGFIPQLRGTLLSYENGSAFAAEAHFDKFGAYTVDHARHADQQATFGTIEAACPGLFTPPVGELDANYNREDQLALDGPSSIYIMSTTGCAHSEYVRGKYLHSGCSKCADAAPASCRDPLSGWTQTCVDWAIANSTYSYQSCFDHSTPQVGWTESKVARHSECTNGYRLNKYDSGCTFTVCNSNPSCCSSTWNDTCRDVANRSCTGGQNSGFLRGFCGWSPIAPPPPSSTF